MRERPNIVENEIDYAVWIPTSTPNGRRVTIQRSEHEGIHILHAESPDLSELYFEVTAYPTILEHETLASEQQAFLRRESVDGALTEIGKNGVGQFAGTSFDFRGMLQGQWKERRFLFVDGRKRTYRVVHDPMSELNVQVLRSLQLYDNP